MAALTFLCFVRALGNEFVEFDDDLLLLNKTEYRGFGWSNLRWMFTTHHMGPYQPLSWLTYALDYCLWGLHPAGFHLTNIVLHAATAVAVYYLARRLIALATGAAAGEPSVSLGAALGALLFALHPLRVESVAWATERRDVLSGVLAVGSLSAYLRYATAAGPRRRGLYWLTFGLFVLGSLAKAIVMTLPVVMLALDAYPLRRLGGTVGWRVRRVWREKIPFVLIAAATAVMAIVGQKYSSSLSTFEDVTPLHRVTIAAYASVFYPWKTLMPVGLGPMYELKPTVTLRSPEYFLPVLLLMGATAVLFRRRGRWPAAWTAWVCYLVTLAPVSGLSQAGGQIAADRYTYLPCLGFTVVVGGWVGRFLRRPAALALGVATLAVLGGLSVRQIGFWHDTQGLFERALAVDPQCAYAHHNLALFYDRRNEAEKSIEHAAMALRLAPNVPQYAHWCGTLLDRYGWPDRALAIFEESARSDLASADALVEYGAALLRAGRVEDARRVFEKSLALDSKHAKALIGMGLVMARTGELDRARQCFARALEKPDVPAGVYEKIAVAWIQSGQPRDGIEMLRQGIRRFPEAPELPRLLAWTLATNPNDAVRNGVEALALAQRAVAQGRESDAQAFVALAAAQAELGDFKGASKSLDRAAAVGGPGAPKALTALLDDMRRAVGAGRPIRNMPR